MNKQIIAAIGALLLLAIPTFAEGAGGGGAGGTNPGMRDQPAEPGAGTLDPTNQNYRRTVPSDESSGATGATGGSVGTSGEDIPGSSNENQQNVSPPTNGTTPEQ